MITRGSPISIPFSLLLISSSILFVVSYPQNHREPSNGQYKNIEEFLLDQNRSAQTRELPSVGRDYYEPLPAKSGDLNSLRNMFRDIMSVNVPLFYDMVRNGSSLGINVLGGLVKVERGQEAERSGLRGHRPLSVRVFGVPVYERGVRVGYAGRPIPPARPEDPDVESIQPGTGGGGNTEELPIIP